MAAMTEAQAAEKEKKLGQSLLRALGEGVLGSLLATAEPFGLCAPFGIAFCSGAVPNSSGLCCLAGTLTGYLLSKGSDTGLRYCAAGLMVFSVSFVFRDTPAFEHRWFLPTAVGIITLLCGTLSFFEGYAPLPTGLRLLLETALSSASSYFFAALRKKRSLWEEWDHEALLGGLLLYGGVIMALCRVRFFHTLTVGHIPAIATVLLCAWTGGAAKGCVAGLTAGLCTVTGFTEGACLTLSCALGGLLAGMGHKKGRPAASLLFLVGYLPFLFSEKSEMHIATLCESALAMILFFSLPKKLSRLLCEKLNPPIAESGEGLLRRYGANHTRQLAKAFHELYECANISQKEWDVEDISTVYDRAAECVCAECLRKELCWHTEYLHMLSGLNDVTEIVRRRGKLSMQELPTRFRESCVHPEAFLQAVNGELRAMGYRRQLRARLDENRLAAYGQLRLLSAVLEQQATELEQDRRNDGEIEKKLLKYLRTNDYSCEVSAFHNAEGHLHILFEGENLEPLRNRAELAAELSALTQVRLCKPTGGSGGNRLLLSERETLGASVGIAAAKKQGESVSGDRGTWFKTERGELCLLISDGMGSGEDAAKEAVNTVRSLESLLRGGVKAEEALDLVNGLMLIKNGDSWAYATVDLLTVNLFSGEARFYKYGAAPSYIVTAGEVRRVRGVSLAAGILSGENENRELLLTKLVPGDLVVLCSDGVASEQSDGWLMERLKTFSENDARILAKELVDEATRQYGRCDDMTVLTLRLVGSGE